jgi:hypothetical protein
MLHRHIEGEYIDPTGVFANLQTNVIPTGPDALRLAQAEEARVHTLSRVAGNQAILTYVAEHDPSLLARILYRAELGISWAFDPDVRHAKRSGIVDDLVKVHEV